MTNEATRMRDAGRSWTEIASRLGVSVEDAKSSVAEDKKARRKKLSETQIAEDRNGLRDMCYNNNCDHMRKQHDENGCTICGRERQESVTKWGYPQKEWMGCDEFVHRDRQVLPWYRRPPEVDPQYVDPDTRLTGNIKVDALTLGVQDLRKWNRVWGDIPRPSLKTEVRRARKKLQAGKLVKKHRDRPRWR